MTTTSDHEHFSPMARLLHWSMALLILAMLLVGVGMVSTVSTWHNTLLALHRPLGIAILLLVILRLAVRLKNGVPALPAELPQWQQLSARLTHYLLYGLMLAMPLIGWAMLSAAGYPIHLFGALYLPPIVPQDVQIYAWLRSAHTYLAFLLFATVSMHLAAALFHGLIRRDGVFSSMARAAARRAGH